MRTKVFRFGAKFKAARERTFRLEYVAEKCTAAEIVAKNAIAKHIGHKSNAGLEKESQHNIVTPFENALSVIEVLKDLKLNQILTITESHSIGFKLQKANSS